MFRSMRDTSSRFEYVARSSRRIVRVRAEIDIERSQGATTDTKPWRTAAQHGANVRACLEV